VIDMPTAASVRLQRFRSAVDHYCMIDRHGRAGAGRFAQQRFRARKRAWLKRVGWLLIVVAAGEAAFVVVLGAVVQPRHAELYIGLGLGIAMTMLVVLADSPPSHIERWRRGAQGERATAKALRRLARGGWTLINDIDTGRGNLDHVLIGPAGVFLLESKSLSGVLRVKRGVLFVRWREDPDHGYDDRRITKVVAARARGLERQLGAHGFRTSVQPVVVLWGSFAQRSIQSKGVAWVRGKEIASVLAARPATLAPEDVARLADLIRASYDTPGSANAA
jgi:hypothetical protein